MVVASSSRANSFEPLGADPVSSTVRTMRNRAFPAIIFA